jgi:hypothetical protein
MNFTLRGCPPSRHVLALLSGLQVMRKPLGRLDLMSSPPRRVSTRRSSDAAEDSRTTSSPQHRAGGQEMVEQGSKLLSCLGCDCRVKRVHPILPRRRCRDEAPQPSDFREILTDGPEGDVGAHDVARLRIARITYRKIRLVARTNPGAFAFRWAVGCEGTIEFRMARLRVQDFCLPCWNPLMLT